MVTTVDKLLFLFPSAQPFRDFAVDETGSVIWWNLEAPQPTIEELDSVGPLVNSRNAKQALSTLRYDKETQGISIEGQRISSERDEIGHWYPRFASAYAYLQGDASTNPTGQYPYKPKDGDPVILTAAQSVRAYQCLAWYINACFATEAIGVAMLAQGIPLTQILAALQWPQTTFTWEAPQ